MLEIFKKKPKMIVEISALEAYVLENQEKICQLINKIKQEYGGTHTLAFLIKARV